MTARTMRLISVIVAASLLLCAAPTGTAQPPISIIGSRPTDIPMSQELWQYLRKGLNYVEASGREYPPDFLHPGGKAYGPLALTPIAIKDVLQHHKEMSRYTLKDALTRADIYEKCAIYYADLLLRHYIRIGYSAVSREELFDILQKAWFLGPGLYKKGQRIPSSRQKNAVKYIVINN